MEKKSIVEAGIYKKGASTLRSLNYRFGSFSTHDIIIAQFANDKDD